MEYAAWETFYATLCLHPSAEPKTYSITEVQRALYRLMQCLHGSHTTAVSPHLGAYNAQMAWEERFVFVVYQLLHEKGEDPSVGSAIQRCMEAVETPSLDCPLQRMFPGNHTLAPHAWSDVKDSVDVFPTRVSLRHTLLCCMVDEWLFHQSNVSETARFETQANTNTSPIHRWEKRLWFQRWLNASSVTQDLFDEPEIESESILARISAKQSRVLADSAERMRSRDAEMLWTEPVHPLLKYLVGRVILGPDIYAALQPLSVVNTATHSEKEWVQSRWLKESVAVEYTLVRNELASTLERLHTCTTRAAQTNYRSRGVWHGSSGSVRPLAFSSPPEFNDEDEYESDLEANNEPEDNYYSDDRAADIDRSLWKRDSENNIHSEADDDTAVDSGETMTDYVPDKVRLYLYKTLHGNVYYDWPLPATAQTMHGRVTVLPCTFFADLPNHVAMTAVDLFLVCLGDPEPVEWERLLVRCRDACIDDSHIDAVLETLYAMASYFEYTFPTRTRQPWARAERGAGKHGDADSSSSTSSSTSPTAIVLALPGNNTFQLPMTAERRNEPALFRAKEGGVWLSLYMFNPHVIRENFEASNYWIEKWENERTFIGKTSQSSAYDQRNRCPDWFRPFADTAVQLSTLADDPLSRYIHASHVFPFWLPSIPLAEAEHFIITEAPVPPMYGEFWRMVYEQGANLIVMLTPELEVGMPYAPFSDKVVAYGTMLIQRVGDIELISLSDSIKSASASVSVSASASVSSTSTKDPFCIVREYRIQSSHNPSLPPRTVRHIHCLNWADGSVLSIPHFLALYHLFRTKQMECTGSGTGKGTEKETGATTNDTTTVNAHPWPVVVHCAAGVGRAGSFVWLDLMLREWERYQEVHPFRQLEWIRQCRPRLVQTYEQARCVLQTVEAYISETIQPEFQ